MKKGKNDAIIGSIIGILLAKPLFKLISETMGEDIGDKVMIGLFLLLGVMFICLAIWVLRQKRYVTVVTFLFLGIAWFIAAYGTLIDNLTIMIIGLVVLLLSVGASYFSIIRFNKKHGINR